MSILFQCFYWNSPILEKKVGGWWKYLDSRLDELHELGIQYLWLPPLSKSCEGQGSDAMGYDAYDYYDLGDYDQKGSTRTLFGNSEELRQVISHAHERDMIVIAELLFSHCRGGEAEMNPYTGTTTMTRFNVKSGKFIRDYEDFPPCKYDKKPNNSPWKHLGAYDYCYASPHVYKEFMDYAAWLHQELHIDAFRYDYVKAYPAHIPLAVQNYLSCMSIGEYWDEKDKIIDWLHTMEYKAMAYDFPLRGMLTDMCNLKDWNAASLWGQGLVFEHPYHAVTFVDNHDTERDFPIYRDKLMAYAFILCAEGLASVFWKDYYTEGLAHKGSPYGLERLIHIHHRYAGGAALLLAADYDVLSFLRQGDDEKSGLIIMINTHEEEWKGSWLNSPWPDTLLVPVAWQGRDMSRPMDKLVYGDGRVELYAPARGYVIYVPQWAAESDWRIRS